MELLNEKRGKLKTTKGEKVKDPCDVCDGELYLDGEYTQRVGLIDNRDDVYGWMCPHCKSRFTPEDKPTELYGSMKVEGEA